MRYCRFHKTSIVSVINYFSLLGLPIPFIFRFSEPYMYITARNPSQLSPICEVDQDSSVTSLWLGRMISAYQGPSFQCYSCPNDKEWWNLTGIIVRSIWEGLSPLDPHCIFNFSHLAKGLRKNIKNFTSSLYWKWVDTCCGQEGNGYNLPTQLDENPALMAWR